MSSTSSRSKPWVMNTIFAAVVGVGPAVEPGQIVQQMLRALDHRRTVRLFRDVDDALHPQKIGAEILLQGVEQQPQRLARDRLIAHEAERGDVAIVQAVMVMMIVVAMIVVMVVQS